MSTVLILGAAAVQADAVSSAKRAGHTVHVCAALPGPATPLADKTADFSFTEFDRLAQYIRANDIKCVYSVGSDIAMPVVGWVGENLGLPHFVNEDVARSCNDKTRMRTALGLARFDGNPWFRRVARGDEAPGFPGFAVAVKPADSQGQRGIARVDNEADLMAAVTTAQGFSNTGAAIVEEWLEGPEVSVNCYFHGGEVLFHAVSDRHVWPEYVGLVSGHTMPPTTINSDQSEKAASVVAQAAKILGISEGPVYAQVKVTRTGPRIIEISPRFDGCHVWRLIDRAYGVNLLDALWPHLLEGRAPNVTQQPPTPWSIDFMCLPPGQTAVYEEIPPSQGEFVPYDQPGQVVRAINGRYDKIGYLLRAGV